MYADGIGASALSGEDRPFSSFTVVCGFDVICLFEAGSRITQTGLELTTKPEKV